MLKLKKQVGELLHQAIGKLFSVCEPDAAALADMLEYPPDASMGDLALPCFKLSKTLHKSPVQIADALAGAVQAPFFERVEAVKGYLNFYLDAPIFAQRVLQDMDEAGEWYGSPRCGEGKTVVLDYSSPNVAKPFHIGHLGTTVIGHSLKLLHEFAGYRCVGINYLGDWGTQFGKLIVAYRLWGNREKVEEKGVDALVALYVRINREIDGDAEHGIPPRQDLAEQARVEFHKMEQHDPENIALWKWFVDISLKEYEKTYSQLNITFDSYKGESFYTDKMPAQVEKLRQCGLLKTDDGASIVDLSQYNMPPCLILKRDGSTLYPTRDIAAAVYRMQTYHFDKCIYVTSAQQSLHFAQWFKVVELMGYSWYDRLVHVPYGTVSVNGTKLGTRTGNVVLLKDLFRLAIEKVTAIMEEKNPALKGRGDIAQAVGVGAVVFYYLSNNRMRDISFVLEDALSFDGNTGPYAQYTYARTASILEKAEGEVPQFEPAELTAEEKEVVKCLARFPEQISQALIEYEPSVITRYILDLCAAFNRFYHQCSILNAEQAQLRDNRLKLTDAVHRVLGRALELICMTKTEKI